MFKKSNRNFRTKKQTDSESENEAEKSSPTKPIVQNTAPTNVKLTQNSVGVASQKILSFNDPDLGENDDQESNSANETCSSKEFRVKKSKESRRIMKELKKSKKEKEKMLKMDSSSKIKQENSSAPDTILFNEGIKGMQCFLSVNLFF
jgi:hypothetical protein